MVTSINYNNIHIIFKYFVIIFYHRSDKKNFLIISVASIDVIMQPSVPQNNSSKVNLFKLNKYSKCIKHFFLRNICSAAILSKEYLLYTPHR